MDSAGHIIHIGRLCLAILSYIAVNLGQLCPPTEGQGDILSCGCQHCIGRDSFLVARYLDEQVGVLK